MSVVLLPTTQPLAARRPTESAARGSYVIILILGPDPKKGTIMGKRHRRGGNFVERQMIRNLDSLAQFEEYTSEVLPLLQKAIADGWTAEQIQNHPKVKAALVARQLTIALKGEESKALSAISDLRNRTDGKPTEKREVKVKYEEMSDAELDAKLAELESSPEELN